MADIDLDMVADMEVDKVPTWVGVWGWGISDQYDHLKKLIFLGVSKCSFQEKVKELFPLGGEWGFTYSHILFFWTESEIFVESKNGSKMRPYRKK